MASGPVIAARPREEGPAACPLCREALDGDGAAACAGCGTRYHAACLAELGGCSTLGCARPARGGPPAPGERAADPVAAWREERRRREALGLPPRPPRDAPRFGPPRVVDGPLEDDPSPPPADRIGLGLVGVAYAAAVGPLLLAAARGHAVGWIVAQGEGLFLGRIAVGLACAAAVALHAVTHVVPGYDPFAKRSERQVEGCLAGALLLAAALVPGVPALYALAVARPWPIRRARRPGGDGDAGAPRGPGAG